MDAAESIKNIAESVERSRARQGLLRERRSSIKLREERKRVRTDLAKAVVPGGLPYAGRKGGHERVEPSERVDTITSR